MTYRIPARNGAGIQWEGIRFQKSLDSAVAEMDDEISLAYYDYWRFGYSSPWGPFDTKGDPAADKLQFDMLCMVVQDMYTVAFHNFNVTLHQSDPTDPAILPQTEYRYEYNTEGVIVADLPDEARDRVDETCALLGVEPSLMVDNFKARVKKFTGVDIPMDVP